MVENDAVVHVWPISSGTQGYATPTGTFQPKSAHRMWYSRQYDWTPMPYAIFFVRGVAFHGADNHPGLEPSATGHSQKSRLRPHPYATPPHLCPAFPDAADGR